MNSELKDRVYDIPEEVIEKISSALTNSPGDDHHGIKRAKTLCSEKKVTYGQLKRIIHDIKHLDKDNEKMRYDLYGGELMEKWANTFLDGERQLVRSKKLASHNINNNTGMDGMRKNPFKKTHEKKDGKKLYQNMLKSNSDKTSVSPIISTGLFEQVERMKKLM